jgi:hypothetical protein
MIPASQVAAWDPVFATVDDFERWVGRMRHLGTSQHMLDDPRRTRYGSSLWGAEVDGHAVGIAWDWAQVRGTVVALADPMAIASNVRLVDADGARLDDDRRLRYLNNAVHALNWQRRIPMRGAERGELLAA